MRLHFKINSSLFSIKTLSLLIIFSITGCNLGKTGVYFLEMPVSPILNTHGDTLFVKTQNSIKNSALSIYQIHLSVDNKSNKIYVSADQALNKDYKEIFPVLLNEYKIKSPGVYEYYWLDPDQKTTKLLLSNKL